MVFSPSARLRSIVSGWRRAKRIALTTLAGSYAVTATWLGPFSTGALLGGAAIVGVALYILYLPVLPTE